VGNAKEDWRIINEIASQLKLRTFNDLDEIRDELSKISVSFANVDVVNKEQYPDASTLHQKVTKNPIETENFNFYFTDPISRISKTMNSCNKEFGEQKGFWKKSEVA
jgi:NADH-quinone oxidoreductase subunit G